MTATRALQTSVAKGRAFENAVLNLLSHCTVLRRVGGRNDKGIDLRGFLCMPIPNSRKIPMLVQCKNEKKRFGPRALREFEGTLGCEHHSTIGLMATSSAFTAESLKKLQASRYPIIYGFFQKEGDSWKIGNLVLNRALQQCIPGLSTGISDGFVRLFYKGYPLDFEDIDGITLTEA